MCQLSRIGLCQAIKIRLDPAGMSRTLFAQRSGRCPRLSSPTQARPAETNPPRIPKEKGGAAYLSDLPNLRRMIAPVDTMAMPTIMSGIARKPVNGSSLLLASDAAAICSAG